jgi:hypothetical protein
LETLEQSTNFRIAVDNVRGYNTDLAARVFRSPLAFRGKLRPEMELCARKSSRARLTQSADEWPWAGEIDQLLL